MNNDLLFLLEKRKNEIIDADAEKYNYLFIRI